MFVLFDVPGASRATHTTDNQEGQQRGREREREGEEWTRHERGGGGERFTCHCVFHVLLFLPFLLLHLLRPVPRRHKLSASCSCCLCSPSPRSSPRTKNQKLCVSACVRYRGRGCALSRVEEGRDRGGRRLDRGGLCACVRE